MPPRASLRTTAKSLPEHARGNNRSLVLQTLYSDGAMSRADLARATGLTRVTISDLVAELLGEALVVEQGTRDEARPGKPATLVDIDRSGFRILGIDLSAHDAFRGALLDLDGGIDERVVSPLDGATGEAAVAKVIEVARELIGRATVPILGVGIGSPGVVDLAGVVLTAPNLGWHDLPLQDRLADELGLPVLVANDANVATLAEHSFGDALSDTMLVKIGNGVGAGLLVGGTLLSGARFSAGEIGHVVVGTDGGEPCACGKHGCLETWLATPRLEARLAAAGTEAERTAVLERAGERLGIALAPVVGALDLAEVVLSGPAHLLDGPLARAALDTLRSRTMAEFHGDLSLRGSALGEDIVMRGAAAMVLSGRLGVS
jgi:predicted NBD/HSP70 family sugar kinase